MKYHLLLVDDEPVVCGLTRLVLEAAGYAVTTAESFEEALRLAEETPFSLAIVDILLPHMDGLELLDVLKQNHPRLPVIVFTGVGFNDEAMQDALRKKADGYVSKGLWGSHLVMEVRHVLRQTERSTHRESREGRPVLQA
jgi:DNA-binding response OmpR family regulator